MRLKTLLLILVFYFSIVRAVAQESPYFQQTEIGLLRGKGPQNWDGSRTDRNNLSLHTFHGIKLHPKHVLGLSTGLDFYDQLTLIPIALGWRGFLGKENKPQLVGGIDIGGGAAFLEKKTSTEWEESWYEGGAMTSAHLGVRLPAWKGKSALSVSIGFKRQEASYSYAYKNGLLIPPTSFVPTGILPRGYESLTETYYVFQSLFFRMGLMF